MNHAAHLLKLMRSRFARVQPSFSVPARHARRAVEALGALTETGRPFSLRRRLAAAGAALLVAMMCSASGYAQDVRASIGGRVVDPQGAVIKGAEITLVSDDTNVKRTTLTNSAGLWQVQLVLPGLYHFTVVAPGFRTELREHITLQAADVKQVDLKLVVGAESQTVEVSSEPPIIDTTSATSGTVITERELEDLPSQSHVPTLFATLTPGVQQQDQGNNVVRAWSNDGSSQMVADGGRNNTYSNNFQLDGMPNAITGGDISFIPPMESVQEFRVQTNAYDASIGRQAGATLNMVTRAGGKAYHGVVYEYNQNNIINAKLVGSASSANSDISFNQFGGTIGGPVRIPKLYDGRDKTFFFFAFDKTLNSNPLPGTYSLPTSLERTGDFSKSFTTQLVNGSPQVYAYHVFDPATVDARGNRTEFNGDVIPTSRLDPVALKILSYLPLPNATGDGSSTDSNNFNSLAVRHDVYPVVSVRVDQNWNNSNHSFVTANWDHLTESTDNQFNSVASGNNQTRITKRLGIDHVWTMNDNRLLSMHYTLDRFEKLNANTGAGFNPTQLGMPEAFAKQLQKPSFPYIKGFAGNFGASNAGSNGLDTYQTWSATLTQIHKTHSIRAGGEFWVQQRGVEDYGNQGEFDFDGRWTRQNALTSGGTGIGNTFADFLLGLPYQGNVPTNATAFYSQHYIAGFAQDDWRITPKLTVNVGLRWDVELPVTERFNKLTDRFDPNVKNPISDSAQAAYASILAKNASNSGVQTLLQYLPASAFQVLGAQLFAGVNGTPRSSINPDYTQWQPRVGFAYRFAPNAVIKGGFGKFTEASFVTGGQNGFSRTTALIPTQDNNFTSYDTLSNPFRNGVLAPTGSSLGPLTNLGQGVNWDDPNLSRQYSWEYSLHLQQQYGGWLFEMGYSHNRTYNISWGWNENEPSFALWKQLQAPVFDSNGRPVDQLPWNVQVPNPFYNLPNVTGSVASVKTVAVNQLLNRIPLLGGVTENRPTGTNTYDALETKIEHRYAKGLTVVAAFTWSKLFEDTSFLGPQIAGPVVEHKLGGENRPYVLALTGIWDVPFGRGRHWGGGLSRAVNTLIGDWEVTGSYSASSGIPVVFGTDAFWSGRSAALSKGQRTLQHWFDTTQFFPFPSKNTELSTLAKYPAWTGVSSLPGAGYVPPKGDTARNGVYQDFANYIRNYPTRWGDIRQQGPNELVAGLYKDIPFSRTTRLQLRIDAFNVLNHPRFGGPQTNPGSSTFGQVAISQVNQPRSVELGVKFFY